MNDEDDYLSDKFLQQLEAKERSNKSYSQRRKDAQRDSEIRNLAGRTKSKKELEKEAMDKLKEGMSTSLFEREKLAVAEGGSESKAMRMMSKMGFKPGQALGRQEVAVSPSELVEGSTSKTTSNKKAVPISINLWEGRKGLGAMKRPLSPDSVAHELERAAKAAKTREALSQDEFRSRNRAEFEEKRDEGRLLSAQKTCAVLDEKAGVTFNYLVVNPRRAKLIPPNLLDALGIDPEVDIDDTYQSGSHRMRKDNMERLEDDETRLDSGLARRLREDMKRDALVSRHNPGEIDEDETLSMGAVTRRSKSEPEPNELQITSELVEQTQEFLQQPAKVRLERVLGYMREKYFFCFWCGTEYKSQEDMNTSCPGETEEMHD
ncbi:SubName: Full=Uncharacterized protein {ECO:0000313/EMBL:CCA78091.1} [Serendipita indica DSM 11827]|uniref:G-patch domain-containing protein n=1 Tax=Serendipita indica (strain DSM 11827) TaxID=1109443 RepID=G4U3B5_SERID|nr:SubName: Full=Uncharacterized protein {ECO:0000313/EMBL:CCA78091.1} [Serendipita indica DSM 11827]CCA78091.1 hypothetical protein PIIN_01764 [Serendipita indica DSM 11827]